MVWEGMGPGADGKAASGGVEYAVNMPCPQCCGPETRRVSGLAGFRPIKIEAGNSVCKQPDCQFRFWHCSLADADIIPCPFPQGKVFVWGCELAGDYFWAFLWLRFDFMGQVL